MSEHSSLTRTLLLSKHTLKRARGVILATAGLLALFQTVMIAVAGSIQQSGSFEQLGALLPPFVRQLLGPTIASFLSYAGIVSVGYYHIAVMGAVIAVSIALATVPASEIETGFLELIMARPLARHWFVTRAIAVLALVTVFILAAMVAATWTALETMAPPQVTWPTPRLIVSLAANLGALMLCWGGVAMAIGSGSRRRAVAAGSAGWLALATFLLDYVGRLWRPAEAVAWLSPFRYYSPLDLVMGRPLPLNNLAILAAIAVAGFGAAYFLLAKRDLQR